MTKIHHIIGYHFHNGKKGRLVGNIEINQKQVWKGLDLHFNDEELIEYRNELKTKHKGCEIFLIKKRSVLG